MAAVPFDDLPDVAPKQRAIVPKDDLPGFDFPSTEVPRPAQPQPEPAPRRKPGEIHVHDPLDETRLRFLKKRPQYMLDRGYSPEVLDKYNVGVWNRVGSYMHDRIIVPVRDHEDYLVGFTGRTVRDEEWHKARDLDYNKWLHGRYYDRFPKDEDPFFAGSILFNLNRAKTFLRPQGRMILVEGPLDGFKLDMYGIYNWVASLSTAFGPAHRSLLIKYGVSDLHVAYDNDPRKQPNKPTSSEVAWERINKIVGDLFRTYRVGLPVGRDPGDMEGEEIRDYRPSKGSDETGEEQIDD